MIYIDPDVVLWYGTIATIIATALIHVPFPQLPNKQDAIMTGAPAQILGLQKTVPQSPAAGNKMVPSAIVEAHDPLDGAWKDYQTKQNAVLFATAELEKANKMLASAIAARDAARNVVDSHKTSMTAAIHKVYPT